MRAFHFSILKFSIQVVISLLALFFAMYMIIFEDASSQVYLPVITGIVGYWLPQPTVKYTKEPIEGESVNV